MALLAIGAEVVLMRILVTGHTAIESNPCKALKISAIACFFRMAFHTSRLPVFTEEGKARLFVPEFGCWHKCVSLVAGGTIFGQRLLVVIVVAAQALLLQPQKGFASFFQTCIGHVIGLVTGPAINLPVLARQLVAGGIVVKVFFIKAHHIEFSAVVVAVAPGTFFGAHFGGGMVSAILIYAGFDFAVALQTPAIGHLIADFMAFGTIGQTLQTLMRIGQRAGRELRLQPDRSQQHD